MLRLRLLGIAVLLLAAAAGCNRNKPAVGGGAPDAPAAVASDDFLVARANWADVVNGPIFKEIRDAFGKSGVAEASPEVWEAKVEQKIGLRPSQIDTVTFCIPEFPAEGEPRLVLIVSCNAAIARDRPFREERRGKSDRPGFVALRDRMLLHFPDEKTMALVHESLADRYLAGYAKDRSGWPASEALAKAAEGHTALAVVNLAKAPAAFKQDHALRPFADLVEAKSVTVALDVKDKEIRLGLRGAFADADAAKRAKDALARTVGELAGQVGKAVDELGRKQDLGPAVTIMKEAKRSLSEARIDSTGSDVTASASYQVDFNAGELLIPAVMKVREAAARVKSQNNLKQIALAFLNYESATTRLPVWGFEKMGQPARDLNAKPLLSWRVHILPYIEQNALYQQFKLDEPWDSEHNKKLIPLMPKVFEVPGAKTAPAGQTYYQQVIGPAAMRPGFVIVNIVDGTSNTIAVVEAAEPVIWTKPDDVMIPGREMPKDLKKKFGGHFAGGFSVVMWDGSVRFVSQRVSDTTLWRVIGPDDGEIPGDDW